MMGRASDSCARLSRRYTRCDMENLATDPIEFQRRMLQPPRKGMVIGIVVCMVVFLVAPAVWFIWAATCSDESLGFRGGLLLFAAALLVLPGRSAWFALRRKWKTGRWSISPEERLEMRGKWAAWDTPSRQKKVKIAATILWVMNAGLWITGAVRGANPIRWFSAVAMTFAAVMNLVNLYRKPKPVARAN
jgi:MFS family permease